MASVESPTPSTVSFPGIVRSPSKENYSQHNNSGHPYAIKTTSTAVLSRSNSLQGQKRASLTYVATPASTNAVPLGRSQSRGHRHTRSLSNASANGTPPQPLPLPPKRRNSQGGPVGDDYAPPPTPKEGAIAQLPDNPKDWTPMQLSVYLTSALRLKGGGAIPTPVVKDMAAFTLRAKLSGRVFLRLSEETLTTMGVNQLWRESLLAASRTLRKKVLQGRIWGFGSSAQDEEDLDASVKRERSKRRIPSTVEEDALEEPSSPSPPPSAGFRGGRVLGMVQSFERRRSSSGSISDDGDSSFVTESASQSFIDARLERELRNAGLWINDDAEDGDDIDAGELSASSSDSELVIGHSRDSSNASSQPPAYISREHSHSSDDGNILGDEPTMEDLLSQEESSMNLGNGKITKNGTLDEAPSWGAMMWDKDYDVIGGTAKKITDLPEGGTAAQKYQSSYRYIRPGVINGGEQPRIQTLFGDADNSNSSPLAFDPAPEPEPIVDHDEKGNDEGSSELDIARGRIEEYQRRIEELENRVHELETHGEDREREVARLKDMEQQLIASEAERQKRAVEEAKPKIDLSLGMDLYARREEDDDDDDIDIPWPRPVISPTTNRSQVSFRPIELIKSKEEETQQLIPSSSVAKVETELDDPEVPDIIPDPLLSDLPSYVLLVGVGVCAVVVRVLLRQIGGDRR
ncbi:hypothetical protein FRC17_000450 [Serendipita sp. 399]|nr:hypothetical protein FRC17_000450 [Serendipita sp. 399]